MSDESKVNTGTSTYQDFVYLRAVIVRSVGLGWRDEEFRNKFNDNPVKTMKETFDYDFPFGFDFQVFQTSDYWTPEQTGGWSGPNNKLVMMLPPKPEKAEDAAEALAAYNLDHLNFISK